MTIAYNLKPLVRNTKHKIAIAMSGGVDSSVTAALLLREGHECFGVHLDFGLPGKEKAKEDARAVAKKLGIDFYVLKFEKEFKKEVIDYYLDAYKKGETPNPCIICNPKIKFGVLLDRVKEMGADFLATGHYARIKRKKGVYELYRGIDKAKDQSYFLYKLNQNQLAHALFPLGGQKKTKTRISEH